MTAVVIGKIDGRASLRCNNCKLIQFQSASGKCRKCGAVFETPAPAEVAVIVSIRRELSGRSPSDPWPLPTLNQIIYESAVKRLKEKMCLPCVGGRHPRCQSETCPCVCNDSEFGVVL